MAYVLNGVEVQVSDRAVRPREPARPSRALTVASPEMATRAPRPRETITPGLLTDKLLLRVAAAKGQQKELEKVLAAIGQELKALQARVIPLGQSKQMQALTNVQARILVLQKDAVACIEAIKACAAKANEAANSAIRTGTTRAVTQAAAAAGTASAANTPVAPSVQAAVEAPAPMILTPAQAASLPDIPPQAIIMSASTAGTEAKIEAPAPTNRTRAGIFLQPSTATGPSSGNTVVVESSTASVAPDGTITPGPDAKVVTTPVLTESGGASTSAGAAAPGSSMSLGKIALFGVAGIVAWRIIKGSK
jgi:hypothetical protein